MPILPTSKYINRLSLVLLPEERGKLQALTDDRDSKESIVIRDLINAAYAARFGKKKPPEPRKKYNSAEARAAKAKRKQ